MVTQSKTVVEKHISPISQQEDEKRITALIRKVVGHYENGRATAQEAAIAILEHSAPVANGGKGYGDCKKAATLCRALSPRERNSMIGWFELYSPIMVTIVGDGATSPDNARFRQETAADLDPSNPKYRGYVWNLEAARSHMWYDDPANVNPVPKEYIGIQDFWGEIEGLIDREIKKAQKVSLEDRGAVYAPQVRTRIETAAKQLKGLVLNYKIEESKIAASHTEQDKDKPEVKAEGKPVVQSDEQQQKEQKAA